MIHTKNYAALLILLLVLQVSLITLKSVVVSCFMIQQQQQQQHQQSSSLIRYQHQLCIGKTNNSYVREKRKRRTSAILQSSSSSSSVEQKQEAATLTKNKLAQELLDFANTIGQVGSKTSDENRFKIEKLAEQLIPYSDSNPARIPLEGTHILQYSASPGGSSGQIGPLQGKVEQRFLDDTQFYNVVMFPPLGEIKLLAERTIMDDERIKVKFIETTFDLFNKLTIKKFPVKGVGVWKQLFVGRVNVKLPEETKSKESRILLRIMEAPSLFIIYQILE